MNGETRYKITREGEVIEYKQVYLDGGALFNLYCTEIGKPHNLIVWYQKNGWIDLEVLQWARDMPELKGFPIPGYLETIIELSEEWETIRGG